MICQAQTQCLRTTTANTMHRKLYVRPTANLRTEAEDLLRDLAYVLKLTQAVKQTIEHGLSQR